MGYLWSPKKILGPESLEMVQKSTLGTDTQLNARQGIRAATPTHSTKAWEDHKGITVEEVI